jgi:hypothetical protein
MDTEDDIRAALAHAAGGPPMRLQADDVIARGGRIRRLRKRWAVAGSSVATALVLAVAGFTAGHRGAEPAPVQPAAPELSTVATTPPPSLPEPSPATAAVSPGTPEATTSRGAPATPTSRRPGRTTSPIAPTATQKLPSATTVPSEPPVPTTSR